MANKNRTTVPLSGCLSGCETQRVSSWIAVQSGIKVFIALVAVTLFAHFAGRIGLGKSARQKRRSSVSHATARA